MSMADDIIHGNMPDFDDYIRQGEALDDIDEYGFTPLIETVITHRPQIAEELLDRKVDVNLADMSGRTALHWAVDNEDLKMARLLLEHGANPNAYTSAGLSILVYPVLRGQSALKHLLYQAGAKLDFALDFIYGKLLGHRYELLGDVDILNADKEFVELDFEGFILEFTVAILQDSLRRFTSSYSSRHMREAFPYLHKIMDAFVVSAQLLKLQHRPHWSKEDQAMLSELIRSPLLILPAASAGHAIGFVRYYQWWAKIDRGENSKKEGSINIYQISRPEVFTPNFLHNFLYKKQSRHYFHKQINQELGLKHIAQIPISAQISGNCSWANIQAAVLVAYALLELYETGHLEAEKAREVYANWVQWDQDRALDECIQRFYLADNLRKASLASMLAAVLFQACDYDNPEHIKRAEKILTVLNLPDYYYILKSYLDVYCLPELTRRGNNLLKILDDCGVNPNIGVTPIATGLKEKKEKL